MARAITIHLIPNAHLDPVWLWDWREGLNEGIATCRAVLDLMDEFPQLTFIRGEAAVYAHIARYDPACFRRIQRYVRQGRWDVVGGTWVQPDMNMPATETFARHFLHGIRYFQENLGVRVRVGWSADAFGHAAGLPDILSAAGIEGYAFSRPGGNQVALAEPAFWWEGSGGGRVMGYRVPAGWYGTERDEVPRRLDGVLKSAESSRLDTIGCFYGLGNHGGGPSRRQITDVLRWADEHPDVRVIHSTLHKLFAALREETQAKGEGVLPVHKGEVNFCLRGCYASVAKFKFAYRKAEAELSRAETTNSAVSAGIRTAPADLTDAWQTLLLNSFHDILPGSSMERAYEGQLAAVAHVRYLADRAEADALIRLAGLVDTTVKPVAGDNPTAVPMLVWNPHPYPVEACVGLEGQLDARPLWAYSNPMRPVPMEVRGPDGKRVPFQSVATESTEGPMYVCRKRVVVPTKLPPMGWAVYTMGYVEGGQLAPPPAILPRQTIRNEHLEVALAQDNQSIVVRDSHQHEVTRISAVTVEDPWGSWGGMGEQPESLDLSAVRHVWQISAAETLESGPLCNVLGVKLSAGRSEMELRFTLFAGRNAVDVATRVLWNERSARLKLAFTNAGDTATFDVPGGTAVRPPLGEVPGGRWVRSGSLGFASDGLFGFDLKDAVLRATVCRAARYADDTTAGPNDVPWLAVVDRGELKFRFLLTADLENLPRLAGELERPPVVLPVPASPGRLGRKGSLIELRPASLALLALKPAADDNGFVVRVQATAACKATLVWLGKRVELGRMTAGEIGTWRLSRTGRAKRVNLVEEG